MTPPSPIGTPSGRLTRVGLVVIGRNEGFRLRGCLESLADHTGPTVYVDSGSTDESVQFAKRFGVEVVVLDPSGGYSASRGRNAGVQRIIELDQQVSLVQFVDGDCVVAREWLSVARQFLDDHGDVACVCGRLRERSPEASIYNMLCEVEWDRPSGESEASGGVAMMRIDAFRAAGGFDERLVFGEEADLCLRIRAQGGRIWRLAADMATHDADMTAFTQWWRRSKRGGYAAAEGYLRCEGVAKLRHGRRVARAIGWAVAIPLLIAVLAWHLWWNVLLVAVYPVRVLRRMYALPISVKRRGVIATFEMLSRFAETAGIVNFAINSLTGTRVRFIEYRKGGGK